MWNYNKCSMEALESSIHKASPERTSIGQESPFSLSSIRLEKASTVEYQTRIFLNAKTLFSVLLYH